MFGRKEVNSFEDFFKKQNKKEIRKIFPAIPTWYIDAQFSLYFFALVGFLGTFEDEVLHTAIAVEFQKFLDTCSKLVAASEEGEIPDLKDMKPDKTWLN